MEETGGLETPNTLALDNFPRGSFDEQLDQVWVKLLLNDTFEYCCPKRSDDFDSSQFSARQVID